MRKGNRMRICYVSNNCGSHTERFIRKMEKKHEVHFISLKDVPTNFWKKHPSVSFYNFNLSFPGFNITSILKLIKGTILLRQIVRKLKPDILFGGFIQNNGLICALTNYHPFLLMPWGSDVLIYPFLNTILRKGSGWIIRQADKVTCDAEYVKKIIVDLSQKNPKDVVVFPWGVELDIFNLNIEDNQIRTKLGWENNPIIIMTRNFESVYNVNTFLNILPNLCNEFPELRVILCGSGSLDNIFRKFIISHGLQDKVYFAGYVPRELLPLYYATSDIYVSSALSDGTSLSLLEAMAMGLPVIVSEIPAILEWVKHGYNGFIFPQRNEEALTEYLRQLITDKTRRKKFSKRNKLITEKKANWDRNYEELEKIFQELIHMRHYGTKHCE